LYLLESTGNDYSKAPPWQMAKSGQAGFSFRRLLSVR
jgi:hypothetical protein